MGIPKSGQLLDGVCLRQLESFHLLLHWSKRLRSASVIGLAVTG
jgi:hypothetical protein